MALSPKTLYDLLLVHFGPQHWWPVDTHFHNRHGSDPRFEILVGAILTQNTGWVNVERALANLKKKNMLTIQNIADIDVASLKTLIQPSGFFNQKAQRLKEFVVYLQETYHGDLNRFFHRDLGEIRSELLSRRGIGPETADSILLYAGNHPIFVVDAYTKRITSRIPFPVTDDTYTGIQQFFEHELQKKFSPDDLVHIYQELHALLVELAKQYCKKKKPVCSVCPVRSYCGSSSFVC